MTALIGTSTTGVIFRRPLPLGFLAGTAGAASSGSAVAVSVFLGLPLGFFAGGSTTSGSSPSRSAVTVFLGRPLRLAGASATDAVSDPFSETTVMPLLDALTCTADRIF